MMKECSMGSTLIPTLSSRNIMQATYIMEWNGMKEA